MKWVKLNGGKVSLKKNKKESRIKIYTFPV